MGLASGLAGWCARARSGRADGRIIRRRRAATAEGLEQRRLLAGDLPEPVIEYNFDEGGGFEVYDAAAAGGQNNGFLNGDGGAFPEFRSGDTPDGSAGYLRFGLEGYYWDYSMGGRVDTLEPLHPILGGSATLAFYIRTYQFGSYSPWESPGVTGAEQPGGANDIFWGNLTAEGTIRASAGTGTGAASSAQVIYNGWHHVVHTRDAVSGTIRTYLDGRLVASVVGDGGVKQAAFGSIGATTVHAFNSTNFVTGYHYFNGDLDQVEIYDRALDPLQVAALYGTPASAAPDQPMVNVDTSTIGQIKLEWWPVPGAVGYVVRRATSESGPWTERVIGVNEFGYAESYTDQGLTAGTRYYYRVSAFNGHGESAAALVSDVAPSTGKGVLAHYWNSGFWGSDVRPGGFFDVNWYVSQLPDQTVGVGQSVVYDWFTRAPTPPFSGTLRADNFSTAFSGKVYAPESGEYYFTTRSDDDGLLYVNGQLASFDPGGHGLRDAPYTFPVYLNGGMEYEFLFLHAEQGGGAAVQLHWTTPSYISWGPIPVDYLVADSDPPEAPTGLTHREEGGALIFDFFDHANNEWGYVLERRSAGGPFEPVETGAIATFDPFNGVNFTPTLTDVPVAAGTYEYRVRAYNAEGSAASNIVTVTVGGAVAPQVGAQAFYINDAAWGAGRRPAAGALPAVGPGADFTQPVGSVDFNFGTEPPLGWDGPVRQDAFSTVFSGTLRAAEAGVYEIFLETDDDGYLLVNGQVVSADPGPHLARDPRTVGDGVSRVFPITLEQDAEYNFVALHADRTGGASVVMKWVRPGQSEAEVVPAAHFASNVPAATGATTEGAPLGPASLRVEDGDLGSTFLTLRWADPATGELRYVVERSTNPDFSDAAVVTLPINSTSYTDFDLTPGARYYYRVTAANFYGRQSAALGVSTLAFERTPDAPVALRGAARAAGVNLAFTDGSTTEDEFVVERADAGSGLFGVVGRVAGNKRGVSGGTVRFTDATAVAGRDYVYRVHAANSGGASAPSDAVSIRAGSPGGPGADAVYFNEPDFTGTSVALGGVAATQNFGAGSPAAGIDPDTFSGIFQAELLAEFTEAYTFYTASDDGVMLSVFDADTGQRLLSGPNNGLRFNRSLAASGFQDTVGVANLVAGRRYLLEWRFVERASLAGYRVGWSSPSVPQEVIPTELLFPVDRADVPLFEVGGLSASAFGAESVTVRWVDQNFGETGFLIERKRASDPDGAFAAVGTAGADASSFSDTSGVGAGVTYAYRVTAVRGDAAGPTGGAVTVTPGTTGGFTYNGSAVFQPGPDGDPAAAADNAVLLTAPNVGAFEGSAFTNNAVAVVSPAVQSLFGSGSVRGFTVAFDFVYPGGFPNSNEGMAFVIQRNAPTAVGAGGAQSGYGGIPNSFAVLFQPAYQTTYAYVNGASGFYGQEGLPFFYGYGYGTRVELEYDADNFVLKQRLSELDEFGQPGLTWERDYYDAVSPSDGGSWPVAPLDIPAMMGGDYGFFGFTASGPQLQQVVRNFSVNGRAVQFLPQGVEPPPPPANTPPAANAGGPYAVAEGGSLTLDASASADEDGDALTYSWDVNGDGAFGDATGATPTLSWAQLQALGIGDGPASYVVAVRVDDGKADPVAASATLDVSNAAPTATFTGTASITEGGAAAFDFTGAADASAGDQAAGFAYSYAVDWDNDGVFADDEAVAGATGSGHSITFPDDGVFNVRGRITDRDGGYADYVATVTVANADPVAGAVAASAGPRLVDTDVEASVSFTDAGVNDTHTVVWSWGDGSTSEGVVSGGTATGTHRYAAPGLYTVTAMVVDDDGGWSTSTYQHVVVYDPNAGSVEGSGWVQAGADRATFELNARYRQGQAVPTGSVVFGLEGTRFRSTSLAWLVVRPDGVVHVRGSGTVNGVAGYSFLLTVSDGGRAGDSPDRLRMKIWNDATGDVVFDSQPGDEDDGIPVFAIGGGNVVLLTA